jgi:predicted transcriptional regulator
MADMTTIKVSRQVREKISALASGRGVTQNALLADLLEHEADREFWLGLAAIAPGEYRAAIAEDGDSLDSDFGFELPAEDGT